MLCFYYYYNVSMEKLFPKDELIKDDLINYVSRKEKKKDRL